MAKFEYRDLVQEFKGFAYLHVGQKPLADAVWQEDLTIAKARQFVRLLEREDLREFRRNDGVGLRRN